MDLNCLGLCKVLFNQLEELRECLLNYSANIDVYLYGSFCKRNVRDSSDIDILVLWDKKVFEDCFDLEMYVIDNFNTRDVDIMNYSRERFYELSLAEGTFEKSISDYMLKLI